jgi:hypothetical protein
VPRSVHKAIPDARFRIPSPDLFCLSVEHEQTPQLFPQIPQRPFACALDKPVKNHRHFIFSNLFVLLFPINLSPRMVFSV